jgi:hypothetical protein
MQIFEIKIYRCTVCENQPQKLDKNDPPCPIPGGTTIADYFLMNDFHSTRYLALSLVAFCNINVNKRKERGEHRAKWWPPTEGPTNTAEVGVLRSQSSALNLFKPHILVQFLRPRPQKNVRSFQNILTHKSGDNGLSDS